eukprot:3933218-Rhodomonas_salina.2
MSAQHCPIVANVNHVPGHELVLICRFFGRSRRIVASVRFSLVTTLARQVQKFGELQTQLHTVHLSVHPSQFLNWGMLHAHLEQLFDRQVATLGEERRRVVEESVNLTNWECAKPPCELKVDLGSWTVAAVAVVIQPLARRARKVDVPVSVVDVVSGDQIDVSGRVVDDVKQH